MELLDLNDRSELARFGRASKPVWVFDVDHHRMWWANREGLAFWNADTLETLAARNFGTDSQTVRTRLERIFEAAAVAHPLYETWTVYPAGKPRMVLVSCHRAQIEQGVRAVLFEMHSVIEGSMDPESWRLLEAARATSLMVSTFAMDGRLLSQNPAAHACYGGPLTGVEHVRLADRIGSPDVARQIISRVDDNEAMAWETKVRTLTGARTHRIAARKGRDPVSGEFVAILSEEDVTELAALRQTLSNVNERLEVQIAERTERLRQSEERYQLAVQTAAIWDWEVAAGRLFVSPGFIREMGFDEATLRLDRRPHAFLVLVHREDRDGVQRALDRHLATPDAPFAHEARFRCRDGTVRWVRAQGNLVAGPDGKALRSVGLLSDITERKELEASLLAAQRLEAVGQLTGGIAHDFNNLLTVIQGNVELLREINSADPELIAAILSAVGRGADLTRQLLAFARKQTLNPVPVDLGALLTRMRKSILRLLGEAVSVQLDLPPDLGAAHADPAQLEAAILNIAINARDAMHGGGDITIRCRNREIAYPTQRADTVLPPGAYLEIAVSDTGQGMAPNVLARAFEPFFTTKTVGQGSGLGLSMVLGFSRQSGGDASIESAPEQGTTVTMLVPRAAGHEVALPPEPEPSAPARGTAQLVHILEDNPDVQATLVRLVESLGYRVTASSDAQAALARAVAEPAALYLTDVILSGGQNGYEFAEQLQTKQPGARILLMSGYPNTAMPDGIARPDGPRLLRKPLDRDLLARAIQAELWAGKTAEKTS